MNDLLNAVSLLRNFINDDANKWKSSCTFERDEINLVTDWGYFEEGLNEIERYANEVIINEMSIFKN